MSYSLLSEIFPCIWYFIVWLISNVFLGYIYCPVLIYHIVIQANAAVQKYIQWNNLNVCIILKFTFVLLTFVFNSIIYHLEKVTFNIRSLTSGEFRGILALCIYYFSVDTIICFLGDMNIVINFHISQSEIIKNSVYHFKILTDLPYFDLIL